MTNGFFSQEFVAQDKMAKTICGGCSNFLCCVYAELRDRAPVTKCDEFQNG